MPSDRQAWPFAQQGHCAGVAVGAGPAGGRNSAAGGGGVWGCGGAFLRYFATRVRRLSMVLRTIFRFEGGAHVSGGCFCAFSLRGLAGSQWCFAPFAADGPLLTSPADALALFRYADSRALNGAAHHLPLRRLCLRQWRTLLRFSATRTRELSMVLRTIFRFEVSAYVSGGRSCAFPLCGEAQEL